MFVSIRDRNLEGSINSLVGEFHLQSLRASTTNSRL
jgi:hypothetical protein